MGTNFFFSILFLQDFMKLLIIDNMPILSSKMVIRIISYQFSLYK